MGAKLHHLRDDDWLFFCPGCKCSHFVRVAGEPKWSWNGSVIAPTFAPSIMINRDTPSQCHSFVTDGQIKFLNDCYHDLKGQTVDLPDYET